MSYITDIAVPWRCLHRGKRKEKLEMYQDLRRDVARLCRVNVIVTPVVVEALGMVTKNLEKRRQQIGVSVYKNGIPTESGIAWNRKNFFEKLLRPQVVACIIGHGVPGAVVWSLGG